MRNLPLFSRPPFLLLLLAGLFIAGCECHPDCTGRSLIRVEPSPLIFSTEGGDLDATVITTLCWKMISKPDWITAVEPANGCGKTAIVVTASATAIGREGKIIFLADNGDRAELIVKQVAGDIPPVPPVLTDGQPYVGAFWKANEKGERIIRLKGMNDDVENQGDWSATVTWCDARWAKEEILLSMATLTELESRGIYSASPGNPEANLVTSGAQTISGTINAANPDILFRIGLTNPFTTKFEKEAPNYTSTWPARYAVITISYNNHAKYYNIYLRQGEGADYVMRNGDYGAGDLNSSSRPNAVRFSPYNLTATELNAQVDISGATPAVNPGIFTNYPTQAGGLFQWVGISGAGLNEKRFAASAATGPFSIDYEDYYDEYDPESDSWFRVELYYPSLADRFWTGENELSTDHETCPPGYRRPNDGPTSYSYSAGLVANSEFRQSLWLNPPTGDALGTDNSVWGYYADGFFDRLPIVDGVSSRVPGTNSSVATDRDEVAHTGCLFFNPATQASLFFPAAGLYSRVFTAYYTLDFCGSGVVGVFFSSTSDSKNASALVVWDSGNQSYMLNNYLRSTYSSIRCVK